MKNVIIAAAVLFAAIAGNADSINPETFVRVSQLRHLEGFEGIFGTQIVGPTVSVNPLTRVATLKFQQYVRVCPPPPPGYLTCMAIGSRLDDVEIELPIVEVKTQKCGATVYIAKEDKRAVDGSLQTLKIVDNSTMTCEIAIPEDQMTQVTYVLETSGQEQEPQTFNAVASGTLLKSPYVEFKTQPYDVQ